MNSTFWSIAKPLSSLTFSTYDNISSFNSRSDISVGSNFEGICKFLKGLYKGKSGSSNPLLSLIKRIQNLPMLKFMSLVKPLLLLPNNSTRTTSFLFTFRTKFSVKKTSFYDESSFLKIIGDVFRTEHIFSFSNLSYTDNSNLKFTAFL